MKFYYKARHKLTNDLVEGFLEAKDEKSAVSDLLNQDLIPTDINQAESNIIKNQHIGEVFTEEDVTQRSYRLKDYVFFFRHLSDLMEAGFPLLRSLDMVVKECPNKSFASLIDLLKMHIKEGGFLSDAMSKFPKVFPSYFIALIKSSEVNNQVVAALKTLADDIEKKWKLQKTITQSLMYPLIILIIGVLSMIVLLVFVLPRVSDLFADFDVLLPLSTRIVMGLSDVLISYGVFIVFALAGGAFLLKKFFEDKQVRFSFDEKILKVPFIGHFFMLIDLTRFFRVLGISIENGVDLVVAFRVSLGVLSNQYLKQEFSEVLTQVMGGEKLSTAFKRIESFPDSFYGLIAMGEQKASLGKDFIKIANNYDEQVQEYSQKCVDLIGPVILVCVVAFVGMVLISVMMPILQMNMSI